VWVGSQPASQPASQPGRREKEPERREVCMHVRTNARMAELYVPSASAAQWPPPTIRYVTLMSLALPAFVLFVRSSSSSGEVLSSTREAMLTPITAATPNAENNPAVGTPKLTKRAPVPLARAKSWR